MIKATNAIQRAYNTLIKRITPKKEQTTFCYCPECNNELVGNGNLISDAECVTYQCADCHTISEWDFDAPAPLLLRVNGVDFDSDTARHEACSLSH